jgi:hypothetical protein
LILFSWLIVDWRHDTSCCCFALLKMAASTRDFYIAGNQLVGRSGKRLGNLLPGGPEDLRFRSHFGGPVALASRAWSKMIVSAILPPNLRSLRNYLMALMFMATYPKSEKKFCDNVGGIDPKTMHKCIDPYVDALFELNFEVVSLLFE